MDNPSGDLGPMLQLSSEVWQGILGLVDRKTLLNVRQASQLLCREASALIRTICVSLYSQTPSSCRFRNIAHVKIKSVLPSDFCLYNVTQLFRLLRILPGSITSICLADPPPPALPSLDADSSFDLVNLFQNRPWSQLLQHLQLPLAVHSTHARVLAMELLSLHSWELSAHSESGSTAGVADAEDLAPVLPNTLSSFKFRAQPAVVLNLSTVAAAESLQDLSISAPARQFTSLQALSQATRLRKLALQLQPGEAQAPIIHLTALAALRALQALQVPAFPVVLPQQQQQQAVLPALTQLQAASVELQQVALNPVAMLSALLPALQQLSTTSHDTRKLLTSLAHHTALARLAVGDADKRWYYQQQDPQQQLPALSSLLALTSLRWSGWPISKRVLQQDIAYCQALRELVLPLVRWEAEHWIDQPQLSEGLLALDALAAGACAELAVVRVRGGNVTLAMLAALLDGRLEGLHSVAGPVRVLVDPAGSQPWELYDEKDLLTVLERCTAQQVVQHVRQFAASTGLVAAVAAEVTAQHPDAAVADVQLPVAAEVTAQHPDAAEADELWGVVVPLVAQVPDVAEADEGLHEAAGSLGDAVAERLAQQDCAALLPAGAADDLVGACRDNMQQRVAIKRVCKAVGQGSLQVQVRVGTCDVQLLLVQHIHSMFTEAFRMTNLAMPPLLPPAEADEELGV